MIGGLVLAAGAATRFGGRKQLAQFRGRPMLEWVLAAMASATPDRVCVVLGADAEAIVADADLHGAEPVVCASWADGQAASLRAGVGVLAEADAIVVALGDQPLLSPQAVNRVLAARGEPAEAVRATYAGKPGHPVLIERRLFEAVGHLDGDAGARELLERVSLRDVPCDGLGRPDDVDTPDQLEALSK